MDGIPIPGSVQNRVDVAPGDMVQCCVTAEFHDLGGLFQPE